MNVVIKNDIIGEFELELSEKYSKRLASSPEHDRHFIENNATAFMELVLAFLTCKDRPKRTRVGASVTFWIFDNICRLGLEKTEPSLVGEFRWKLLPKYADRLDQETKIHDLEKMDWYIDRFFEIMFAILLLPNNEERKERGWKKNNLNLSLRELASRF